MPTMSDDDLKRLLAENAAEVRRHFDAAVERVEKNADRRAEQSRHHFEVISESMRNDVRLVAEAVALVDEKLMRQGQRLEEKIDSGFAEAHGLIRLSYAELDRRVRTLEQNNRNLEQHLTDLQARVERLESTTH